MTGTLLLAVLMLFAPVLHGSGTYRWVRALPMGSGAWQDHWIPDRFPMAIMPSLGPANKLWMVGGLGVWSSADGRGWIRESARPPWGERYGATSVHFRGELWSFGGTEARSLRNEVWHSADGRAWHAAGVAAWSPRKGHAAAVYRDRLWVLGGASLDGRWLNDVWSSGDGERWERLAPAPWTPRAAEYVAAFAGRLWVYGGKGIEEGDRGGFASDVWYLERAR